MEDEDDFGDLYTDIIIPSSAPAAVPSNPTPAESVSRPAPNPNPTPAAAAAAAAVENDDDDWLLGGNDPIPGVDPTGDWADEDEDGAAPAPAPPVKREAAAAPAKPVPTADDLDPLMGGGVGDSGPAIPGLSSSAAAGAAGSDEWDSDSEDDIQIVLNETDGRRGLGEDEGDDEEGDDLVIVADGPHIPGMEEQDWGEDPTATGAEGERKDGGEPGKAAVAPGGRIGYSGGGQGFHPQHHSMFKYVRPGAPGGGAPGAPGQFRPPGPPGPFSGRGRGEWRPAGGRGMNKGFHSSYGMTPWGGSGRGFGGLDFTLPPHKTIFDIDTDTFEEKPWKYPGADISDFFNFGLDEEKWKEFCKQLDQLRLESTMQSRIRVYESGRSEQDYDPDLPPELAAATAHPEISADNRNKTDNGHADFNVQGRGPANVRAPVMTGRPIQVETGYGERLPSIDTRIPRMRESDSVIEIVCQGQDQTFDDTVDQTEKDSQDENKGTHDPEEGKPYPSDKMNDAGLDSNLEKTEHRRRLPVSSESDMLPMDVHARSPPSYKTRGSPRGVRSLKGSSLGQSSSREIESSNEVLPRQISSKGRHDSRRENPVERSETKGDSEGSPLGVDDAADKLSTEDHFDDNDDRIALVDSVEVEGDDATSDPNTPSETNEVDNLVHSDKKQKSISMVEQPTGQNSSEQDELRARNSDNSKGRSGSSKDQQKQLESGEEVLQDRCSKRVNDVRRHRDTEEHNLRRKDEYYRDVKLDAERSHLPSRGREDIHQPYANRDRVDIRGRSYDRVRDTEIWPRREDNVHSRRAKEEDMRLEYNAEVGERHRNKARPIDRNDRDEDLHSRKRLDDGDWRGTRQRERSDMILNRREGLDDSHIKRNKDDENLRRMKTESEDTMHGNRARDDHNRRKRDRDDGNEQKRRDDTGRMREKFDDRHHAKPKDDSWRQRERDGRQRPKQENTLTLQREEGRGTGRGGRNTDDKLVSGARKKEEPRSSVLSKDSQERTRKNEPLRGQGAEENSMQNKGRSDVHPRENNTERNSRQEKQNNNRLPGGSDARHVGRDRHRESTRKGRSSEPNEHDLHRSNKRRREDHENHRSGKAETREASEHENSRNHATSKKSQNPQHDTSSMKQVEADTMSDDENDEDSRRGRSKLERWTSHKEIEYNNVENETTETFLPIKADVQTSANEVGKSDATVGNSDIKGGAETGQTSEKMAEERDRHLDTVERLKRRSERFKLPMPGEKEAPQSKKVDTEVQPPQNESFAADMEVKPERPARKRRWTGS
ncbi:hypothetical protein QOZ80_3AG0218180 [Eleusine coracana subsp. coracana]|nr:hypothetical protein QOZ80_3AG0218180 [Eleusine coracana subsp. coracana]